MEISFLIDVVEPHKAVIFTSKNQEDLELSLTDEEAFLYQELLSRVSDREDIPLIFDRETQQVSLIPGSACKQDAKLALLLQHTGYKYEEPACPPSSSLEEAQTPLIIDRKKRCLKTMAYEPYKQYAIQ